MDEINHFTHVHVLNLVVLPHLTYKNDQNSDEEEEYLGDFVMENQLHGQCNMCKEQIYSFHLSYYKCKEDCNYLLHKFCVELPQNLQNHPSHPNHQLTLSETYHDLHFSTRSVYSRLRRFYQLFLSFPAIFENELRSIAKHQYPDYSYNPTSEWMCDVCHCKWSKFYHYHCSICSFNMDIICATTSKQKMNHPSHPHQLERMLKPVVSHCHACGNEHKGTFYHCTTCFQFWISLDCALLPTNLLIQKATNETFTHPHPLTLAYSFSHLDQKAKFHPRCRVCGRVFYSFLWLYKCDKCQYYVHVDCAISKDSFMSIFLRPGLGKLAKNFEDHDHPNLLHLPFFDESCSLLQHHFLNQDLISTINESQMEKHFGHQHPLILSDTQTLLIEKSISLHNPKKKIELLCNGCVKPITAIPFYMCSQDARHCSFFLHEWCTRLPSMLNNFPGHPEHTLFLRTNNHGIYGMLICDICDLPSNGFIYSCTCDFPFKCIYNVDINCAFMPDEITHESHPNHLLSRVDKFDELESGHCNACGFMIEASMMCFHCHTCNFYLHTKCALLLPKMISHKYDKDQLCLRYDPVENHISEYFCEICEEEIDTRQWFYHCTTSAQSMHSSCAPLKVSCEQAVYSIYPTCVFPFLNVKFGRTFESIRGRHGLEGFESIPGLHGPEGSTKKLAHAHPLTLVQGINSDSNCEWCHKVVKGKIILKCFKCMFTLHCRCAPPRKFSLHFYEFSRSKYRNLEGSLLYI